LKITNIPAAISSSVLEIQADFTGFTLDMIVACSLLDTFN